MSDVSLLNDNQREIYQYIHVERHTVAEAASYFGTEERLILAQITRCRTKGVIFDVPSSASRSTPELPHVAQRSESQTGFGGRPASGPSSNEAVVEKAAQAGPALTSEEMLQNAENLIREAQNQSSFTDEMRSVHPMLLMGCAMQFMKLCGGRLHAHQVLEDVYEALRLMVGGGKLPGITEVTPLQPAKKSSGFDSIMAAAEQLLALLRQQQAQPQAQVQQAQQPLSPTWGSSEDDFEDEGFEDDRW